MPKVKPFEKGIKAMYLRTAIDQLMFGFITGARAALETISVQKAIEMFFSKYGITEDDYPLLSAERTYYKMLKEYIELFK